MAVLSLWYAPYKFAHPEIKWLNVFNDEPLGDDMLTFDIAVSHTLQG